jgi:hypothetical protein
MRTDDAFRGGQAFCDEVNGNHRGIRGENGRRRCQPHQVGKDRALQLEFFGSGFGDIVGAGDRLTEIPAGRDVVRERLILLKRGQGGTHPLA